MKQNYAKKGKAEFPNLIFLDIDFSMFTLLELRGHFFKLSPAEQQEDRAARGGRGQSILQTQGEKQSSCLAMACAFLLHSPKGRKLLVQNRPLCEFCIPALWAALD